MDEKKLREELTKKLIGLGKLAHRGIRAGVSEEEEALKLSKEIAILEKQLYEISGNYIPTREDAKCPSCKTPYEEGTMFCSNCGQNIKEFYEASSDTCITCESMVKKDSNFCGVCGSIINK